MFKMKLQNRFGRKEFEKYSPQFRSEVISPILNKTGLFLTSIPLRNIVGQKTRGIQMQQVLDEGKILIVNLSKGEIGEDASSLLGSIICLLQSSLQQCIEQHNQSIHANRFTFMLTKCIPSSPFHL